MFERFTDRARRVVVLAQEESRLLGHSHIGTEHLLLGVLAEGEGAGARALHALGVEHDWARDRLGELLGAGPAAAKGNIPFTPHAKLALEASLREALDAGDQAIGTGHVLLGVLAAPDGMARRLLAERNIDRAAAAAALEGDDGE